MSPGDYKCDQVRLTLTNFIFVFSVHIYSVLFTRYSRYLFRIVCYLYTVLIILTIQIHEVYGVVQNTVINIHQAAIFSHLTLIMYGVVQQVYSVVSPDSVKLDREFGFNVW